MIGQLDSTFTNDFEYCFRSNCLLLIGEAYDWLKTNGEVSVDWDEETITANIFTHIDESEKAICWNISVSDECRIYNQAILKNKKKAKSAPRIDLKLATNWVEGRKRIAFYVEAKNLIENNCRKSNRKSLLNANRIQTRYISTGIDHFVLGGYPENGCMLGYVVEGEAVSIIDHLNAALQNSSRDAEVIKKTNVAIPYLDSEYMSSHNNGYLLYHYFLKFSIN